MRILLIAIIYILISGQLFGQTVLPNGAVNQVTYQRGGAGADSVQAVPLDTNHKFSNYRYNGRIAVFAGRFWYYANGKYNSVDIPSDLLIGVTNDTNTILGKNNAILINSVAIGNGISGSKKSVLLGDSATGVTTPFNGSVIIGYKAKSQELLGGSVVIGQNASDSERQHSFGFAGATIVGNASIGRGTNLGIGTLSICDECISIGPYTKNTEHAGAGIAIGDNTWLKPNYTGTATHHDTCGGCIVMGDVAFGYGWLNYFIGGGAGMGHNYGACFACQGSSVGYNLDVMTADHQGFFGWYDKTSPAFASNIGFINDIWLGGPVTSTVLHPITWNISSAEGTNQTGTDLTINSSAATGNAATGTIKFNTSDVGSSGTTLQTQTTKLQIGTTNTSNVLMNYGSDLSGSYTTRSMIDKGYGTATYGTLSQQATNTANIAINTSNIATNTTNIATNTSNIASNTSALATKWSLSGNTGSGNILGQTDNNGFLIESNGDTLFNAARHAINFDTNTIIKTPINASIALQPNMSLSGNGVSGIGGYGAVTIGDADTITNSAGLTTMLMVRTKIKTSNGTGDGITVVDTVTQTGGQSGAFHSNRVINQPSGTPIMRAFWAGDNIVTYNGTYRAFEAANGSGVGFYQGSTPVQNSFRGPTVIGTTTNNSTRAFMVTGSTKLGASTADSLLVPGIVQFSNITSGILKTDVSGNVGIATAGTDYHATVANARLTAQTAAGNVVTYTPSATAEYMVGAYLHVTAIVTDVIKVSVSYYDETATLVTQDFFASNLGTASISSVGNVGFSPIQITAGSGGPITVLTTLTTSIGTITYNVSGTITKLD